MMTTTESTTNLTPASAAYLVLALCAALLACALLHRLCKRYKAQCEHEAKLQAQGTERALNCRFLLMWDNDPNPWRSLKTERPCEDEFVETARLIDERIVFQDQGFVDFEKDEGWRHNSSEWGDDSTSEWSITHWRPILSQMNTLPPWTAPEATAKSDEYGDVFADETPFVPVIPLHKLTRRMEFADIMHGVSLDDHHAVFCGSAVCVPIGDDLPT